MNSHRIFQKSRLRRVRAPTAVHGTWLEENLPPAGERAPRITPDSFPGSAGCAPGSPAPASAASRRLARSHAGRSTASGAWEAAALPCAARSSRSHLGSHTHGCCVATSEHHGGHAHVLILRHVAPRLAHALGRLAAGGAAKRTKQIAQVFRSQHKNSRFRSLCDSGASGTPPCATPTRRAWAACSGDALVGSPPRARTAPHVFLGARCQQRCGTSHGTGNARTHLGWRSGKRRGAIILAPTAARRAGKLGALRGTALRA